MSLRDCAYRFKKTFIPLYKNVASLKFSIYFRSFSACPSLLFKSGLSSYSVYNHSTPYEIWHLLFRHKNYGIAFFAYYTAIFVCYPRLCLRPYAISFERFWENMFYTLNLFHFDKKKKRYCASIDYIWFENFIQDARRLAFFTKTLERANTWRLFIASLDIYNNAVSELRAEYDHLSLIPLPGESWSVEGGQSILYGRRYGSLGILEFDNGTLENKTECIPPLGPFGIAPVGWRLDDFFQDLWL